MEIIREIGIKELIKKEYHGFINKGSLPGLIREDRLCPCLVRCGSGRFSCPAQDVTHFTAIIDQSDNDYVRDVSLVAGY